jgi:hypothetical protein
LENFGGPLNKKCWHILRPFGLIYGHLVYYVAVWYSLRSFDIFSPILECLTKKNLATLDWSETFFETWKEIRRIFKILFAHFKTFCKQSETGL